AILPFPTEYEPYTAAHVYEMLQLLLYSGLAFFIMLPLMKRTLTITLDLDWIYRKLAIQVIDHFAGVLARFMGNFAAAKNKLVTVVVTIATEHHNPRGILARTTPAGVMAFWVVVLLCAYLVIYLFV
ncbi:Na+/H+ antiporter subunit D, partial [Pseudomonadota bacterium]